MERIEKEIEVNAPLNAVYNQWTQFEEFPLFMEGVKAVRQRDDRRLEWHAEIMGQDVRWESEITEQIPDQRIAWRSSSGRPNAGTVFFNPIGADRAKITLVLEYEPLGAAEKIADALGAVSLRVEGDLRRFRDFIEERRAPTGGWRGEIREGQSS